MRPRRAGRIAAAPRGSRSCSAAEGPGLGSRLRSRWRTTVSGIPIDLRCGLAQSWPSPPASRCIGSPRQVRPRYTRRPRGRDSRRIRVATQDPRTQQALLPVQPLADLDLRLLHRARAADLRSVRARASTRAWRCGSAPCSSAPASPACAGSCRASSRSRTSSASPRIGRTRSIAACATRSRGARSSRSRCSNIAGLVVAIVTGQWYLEADLPRTRTFRSPDRSGCSARSGQLPRVKASTKGEGHERRLFLRIGVGRLLRAARALAHVEGDSAHDSVGDSLKLVIFRRHSRRSSATSRASAACRARVRSCPASSPSPTNHLVILVIWSSGHR